MKHSSHTHVQAKMIRVFFRILIYYLVDLISIRQSAASIVVALFRLLLYFAHCFCLFAHCCCRRCHSHNHINIAAIVVPFSSRGCCCRWHCCLNRNHTMKTNTFFQIHTHTPTDYFKIHRHYREAIKKMKNKDDTDPDHDHYRSTTITARTHTKAKGDRNRGREREKKL